MRLPSRPPNSSSHCAIDRVVLSVRGRTAVLELRVLAVDEQRHVVVDRHSHRVAEDAHVAGPAAVAHAAEGLREHRPVDLRVGRELDVVRAELLHVLDVLAADVGVGAGRPGDQQRPVAELEDRS